MDNSQKPIIKAYNRLGVHNNLDRLQDYIVDMDLAIKYQKYNDWNHGIIDRTGSMKHFLNVKIDSYVPKYIENYKKTFSSVTKKRAQELVNKNKTINILYSGGLDSMTIVSAFYNLDMDPNQVVIYLTHDSLYESGSLFDDVIVKRFNRYHLCQAPLNINNVKFTENDIVVTGHHGNILMNRISSHIPEKNYDDPYDRYISKDYIDFYQPFIDAFPKKIETIEQFYTYFSFNFNWCLQSHVPYTVLNNVQDKLNIFFDTLDYQNYFISCEDDKRNKNPMRKFILNELGSKAKDYITYKKIRNSYINSQSDWLLFLDNFQIIHNKDL